MEARIHLDWKAVIKLRISFRFASYEINGNAEFIICSLNMSLLFGKFGFPKFRNARQEIAIEACIRGKYTPVTKFLFKFNQF